MAARLYIPSITLTATPAGNQQFSFRYRKVGAPIWTAIASLAVAPNGNLSSPIDIQTLDEDTAYEVEAHNLCGTVVFTKSFLTPKRIVPQITGLDYIIVLKPVISGALPTLQADLAIAIYFDPLINPNITGYKVEWSTEGDNLGVSQPTTGWNTYQGPDPSNIVPAGSSQLISLFEQVIDSDGREPWIRVRAYDGNNNILGEAVMFMPVGIAVVPDVANTGYIRRDNMGAGIGRFTFVGNGIAQGISIGEVGNAIDWVAIAPANTRLNVLTNYRDAFYGAEPINNPGLYFETEWVKTHEPRVKLTP